MLKLILSLCLAATVALPIPSPSPEARLQKPVSRSPSPCKPDPFPVCPTVWLPVCAEGITYSNECFAEAACAENVKKGECSPSPPSPPPCSEAFEVFYDEWKQGGAEYANFESCLPKCENDPSCWGVQFSSSQKYQCYKISREPYGMAGLLPMGMAEARAQPNAFSVFRKKQECSPPSAPPPSPSPPPPSSPPPSPPPYPPGEAPLPPPSPPSVCQKIEYMTDVRALYPTEWCNTDKARRADAALCEAAYASTPSSKPSTFVVRFCKHVGTEGKEKCVLDNDAAFECPKEKDDPCAGKACGDECLPVCPPDEFCLSVVNFCQPDGSCGIEAPKCDTSPPTTGSFTAGLVG